MLLTLLTLTPPVAVALVLVLTEHRVVEVTIHRVALTALVERFLSLSKIPYNHPSHPVSNYLYVVT